MSSGVQTLRFRGPETKPKPETRAPDRHSGILQDQLRRSARRPWTPSASLAFRILVFVRFIGAMFSNIDDCDEVFNFWEPLHYLIKGTGFQTWETSPEYAIRSWAYILLHAVPAKIAAFLFPYEKRPAFFAVRIFLAVACTLCEVRFYRVVRSKINERVGRYVFFMLLTSAGMFSASTAFLPSSFAMYMTLLAFSYALEPVTLRDTQRTFFATILFATGAIIGWPFALALAIPFVVEELFVYGADVVPANMYASWITKRWQRLFGSGVVAALIFIPVVGIDSLAYNRLAIVPWNIVRYNILGGSERGPDLYGTSPWYFYSFNLALNFNILAPLALVSIPALGVTYAVDRKRLGGKVSPEQSSPFTLLFIRLLPLYLWFGVLSAQAHKEERFMFPAYPLICFNAAVTLYLIRGWMEVAFISATNSPYRASISPIFRTFTLSVITAAAFISLSRVLALYHYYHAPLDTAFALESLEIQRLYNATGLMPSLEGLSKSKHDLPHLNLNLLEHFDLTVCLGKEWHRFMGSYLIPENMRIEFIKSDFNGLLPGHFIDSSRVQASGASKIWPRPGTTVVPKGYNDLNKEEASHYIPVEQCDYLIDLDYPEHPIESTYEPRYAIDAETWDRVHCDKFLDPRHSFTLTRVLWLPGPGWQKTNSFGDYCLLRHRKKVSEKEARVAKLVSDGIIQHS